MPNKPKIQKTIEEVIKKYIDDNVYLFKTDTDYEVQCRLKPRLMYLAVENACEKCEKTGLTKKFSNFSDYNNLAQIAMNFAVYYMSVK